MCPEKRILKIPIAFITAILCLMGTTTGGAQANWLVEEKELTTNETVSFKASTPFVLAVPAMKLEITCTTVASSGFKLIAESAVSEGSVNLSGCATFVSGVLQNACKPTEPITLGLKKLIILHNGKNYLLDEGIFGEQLGVVKFSKLCSLGGEFPIGGKVPLECLHMLSGAPVFLDCQAGAAVHEVRPAPRALFPNDKYTFGVNEAIVEGAIEVSLSGANAGKSWGGHV